MSWINSIALFCIALVALIGITEATPTFPKTELEFRAQFGSFINQYNRDYKNAEEYEKRYAIFKANIELAEIRNSKSKTATFGVTKFADMSQEERKAFLGKLPSSRHLNNFEGPTTPVPPQTHPTQNSFDRNNKFGHFLWDVNKKTPSFDLRKQNVIPVVRDQGLVCGSCWAHSSQFGVAAAALSQGFTNDPKKVDFSPQQLVDCCGPEQDCDGCDGGDIDTGTRWLASFGGSILEKDYPYTAETGKCHANKTQIAMKVTGFEWVIDPCFAPECFEDVDSQFFLSKLQQRNQTAAVCVTMDWFDYVSGVYDLEGCIPYGLTHCLGGVIEYTAKEDSPNEHGWITLQNSFGENWGENGNIRLQYIKKDHWFNNPCGVFTQGLFANIKF